MSKKIINLFGLVYLGCQLGLSLFVFSLEFFWVKFRLNRFLTSMLVLAIVTINILNWQIWKNKQLTKVIVKPALSQNLGEELLELNKDTWLQLKNSYLELNQLQPNSRDFNFNLAKILEVDDKSAAAEKFLTAARLDPNYP